MKVSDMDKFGSVSGIVNLRPIASTSICDPELELGAPETGVEVVTSARKIEVEEMH